MRAGVPAGRSGASANVLIVAGEVLEVHVIADSTGETAARLARAAQAQFPSRRFRIIRHPRISSVESVVSVVESLKGRTAARIVITTLVNPDLRDLVNRACDGLGIRHSDLLGPTLAAIEEITGTEADLVPMRPVGVEADYFTRISAMQYVIQQDDGQHLESLGQADIVLLGASRSGKTPLSMYLGYLGYRTANVPLVLGIDPPPQLALVDRWRLVGLTMDPERLVEIRRERIGRLGMGTGLRSRKDGYADLARVYDEVDQIVAMERRLGAVVVNTTSVALEENAAKIIEIAERRAQQAGGHLREIPGEPRATPRSALSVRQGSPAPASEGTAPASEAPAPAVGVSAPASGVPVPTSGARRTASEGLPPCPSERPGTP